MKARVIIVVLLALVGLYWPAPARADGGVVCAPASATNCARVDASYGTWMVRRGQTLRIEIPSEDVLPASRGEMLLIASGACAPAADWSGPRGGYLVARGNTASWTYDVPDNSRADPCSISLAVELDRCVGAGCEPLPAWLEQTPTARVTTGIDLGAAVAWLFEADVMRWIVTICFGALAASIVARRIRQALEAIGAEAGTAVAGETVAVEDEEAGEWSDERAA